MLATGFHWILHGFPLSGESLVRVLGDLGKMLEWWLLSLLETGSYRSFYCAVWFFFTGVEADFLKIEEENSVQVALDSY